VAFSFGAGNTAKLLRIPLYAAGVLATRLIPRTRDRWVFGCGVGIADGALALWEVVAAHGHPAVWLVDSDRDARDATERGIPWVWKHSARGFWATARARVVVVTHGFGDVNRYAVAGAFIAQLWHGIPLKRVGIDSPATVRSDMLPASRVVRRVLGVLYARTTRRISLLPAASHLVRGRLESAFSLTDGQVPVTGEPRTDVLSQGTPAARRERARDLVRAAVGDMPTPASRLVLYAPTWRDGAADPAVPGATDWAALTAVLDREDAVLLVRSHPLGSGDYAPPGPTARVRAIGSDVLRDATPILPALDALVTDYSSMAYDAGLVGVPVVYLAPDVADYARERGFYGQYEDVAGADYATDWAGATRQLAEVLGDDTVHAERSARSVALSTVVHAHRDGANSQRVYRGIVTSARLPHSAPDVRSRRKP